jgi:enterochelin esterase family protein
MLTAALFTLSVAFSASNMPQAAPQSPLDIRRLLTANQLSENDFRGYFKGNLKEGVLRQSGVDLAFAMEVDSAKEVRVKSGDGLIDFALQPLAGGKLFAGAMTVPHDTGLRYWFEVDGKPTTGMRQLEAYLPDPDMSPNPAYPKGDLIDKGQFKSNIYKGTTRNWWVYVPKQYDPKTPTALMFFQDDQWTRGGTSIALDNLIAKGQIPVMIGVFLEPGSKVKPGDFGNRSFEYDRVNGDYGRMLIEEILPIIKKDYNLRDDAAGRGILGDSSGGICAFTAAWFHPAQFMRVGSFIGSFVDLAKLSGDETGGDDYPAFIRKSDPKPIRVFLQDGSNDLDNPFGNWPLANQQMAKALAYKNYDYTFAFGHGFHSGAHKQAILPSALRWLWRP